MAMDAILKKLESKIEGLAKAYRTATQNEAKLAARVEELERRIATDEAASERVAALEKQKEELASRLENVVSMVDSALADNV